MAQFVPASSAAAPGEDLDVVVRFEQLVGELHLAAMQVAVVTSGVNALSEGVRLKNPLALWKTWGRKCQARKK